MIEELTNRSKLPEILWNFCRYPDQRRLTLMQNPQFYSRFPTTSRSASWRMFTTGPTEQYQDTRPLCVLTSIPGRVFLEFGQNWRAFDNVWDTNRTLIFKGRCLNFRTWALLTHYYQVSVESSRVKVSSENPFSLACGARGVTWSVTWSLWLLRVRGMSQRWFRRAWATQAL